MKTQVLNLTYVKWFTKIKITFLSVKSQLFILDDFTALELICAKAKIHTLSLNYSSALKRWFQN